MKQLAKVFYEEAVRYCNFIKSLDKCVEGEKYKLLLENLLNIYTNGIKLTKIKIDDTVSIDTEIPCPNVKINKYNFYWEVFDAYHLEKPVQGSLTDDISDIYHDLKEGILLYEQNRFQEAISNWKFNFEIHWGSHAVDAIRALHSLIYKELYFQ